MNLRSESHLILSNQIRARCRHYVGIVFVAIATISLFCTSGVAQSWHEEFRETGFDVGDHTGGCVSIDGESVAIGAHGDDDRETDAGAVYIYVRDDLGTPNDLSDDTWVEQQKLYASDGQAGDSFGFWVKLDGDRLAVSAGRDDDNGEDSGSAYIFERVGTTWTQTAKIKPDDGAAGDLFSRFFDLEGNTLAVSSINDNNQTGSLYIFQYIENQWVQQQKIVGSTDGVGDQFGRSPRLVNGILAISARRQVSANRSGSVYLFAYDNTLGSWVETQELTASDGEATDIFSYTIDMTADLMVVGAPWDDNKTGSAYVFLRDDNGTPSNPLDDRWTEQQKLVASDRETADQFGRYVTIYNDTVLVAAWRGDVGSNPDSGSLYFFDRLDNGTVANPFDDIWLEFSELSTNNPGAGAFHSLAINPTGTLIVGDPNASSTSGAFHVFELFDEFGDVAVDVPLDIKSPKGNQRSRTVVSSLFVDENFSIADLDINFDITHLNVSDLELHLVHLDSGGTEHQVQLFSRIGGSGDHFTQTTLDDDVVGLISNAAAPFTGRFVPDGSLAVFEQQDAFGYWYLEVTDYKKSTDGILNSWSIDFLGTLIPPPAPSLSVNDVSVDEGDSGTTPGQFTVTLSELTGEDVMVWFDIFDGSATTVDGDYTTAAASGLLTFDFSVGETTKSVPFSVIGDNSKEPDETFTIELSNAVGGAVISKAVGTATINNDDKKRGRR